MPPTITTTVNTLQTPDGLTLYTKTWSPPTSSNSNSKIKARLVFIHGFSDHCNFYDPLFPCLAREGIRVYSFDQRGWGRSVHSPAQKGLTGPTRQILEDISFFIRNLPGGEEEGEEAPLFLMGHSMGGGQVLTYISLGPEDVKRQIRGYLCEAPFVSLHERSRPWKGTVVLGRLVGRLLPHRQMVQQLDPKKLCRDPDVCKAFEEDALCHDTGTLEGLAGMLDRASDLQEGKVVVREGQGEGGKTRLWIGFGTGDEILSEDICRKWYEKCQIEDKEYKRYEGWYHKLHAEPGDDKFQFARDVSKWILDRSGPLENNDSTATKPKL
ncbi:Hypothetical predicted protein [Lecanosticta acicola]|uniref:Serine aminopeptidase S33 domain-containing protein n=1 Tax=Lecanosticta acicola TaxID=111012 RepID=A0AAI8YUE7_9PEZI|nr:Hypothetical predicted protein [Lecanosticta acicola]